MDAALTCFAKRGYGATTIEEIVSGAGVARGTFYLHFENKLEVMRALTEELEPGLGAIYEELDELLAGGSRSDLRAWMVRALNWFDMHRTMILAWQELGVMEPTFVGVPPFLSADHMPRYLAQWPKSEREAARLRVVLLVHQMTRAFLLSHVRQQLPVDDELLVDTLTDIWMSALKVPRARLESR
jgi:AcrR family transcriptional regulator